MNRIILISFLSLVLGFFTFVGCERIDAGHAGIKVNLTGSAKGVQDIVEVTGWCFYSRFTSKIYEFPTFVQHKQYTGDEAFIVNSKDGSEFHVSPILNYAVKSEKVASVFQKYRRSLPEIEDGFIKTAVYDAFRIAANRYTADSLISNRESFEVSVKKILESQILSEGFLIQQFTSNLNYPETFKKSIEAKNAAVQKALQIENEVKQTEAKAKISIVQNEAAAKVRNINAEAYANAIVKQARADAEANKMQQQSITPLLVQWQLAQTWDGKLPLYSQVPQLFKDISK